jgi:phosphoglycolate phosphatase/putative hydrolase of the HAD superfamily
VAEALLDPAGLKAVIFDLDGTLYLQDVLRRAMLVRLVRAHAMRPVAGVRTARILTAYRKAQEALRGSMTPGQAPVDLADVQLQRTCEVTRAQPGLVSECVSRWMEYEPLAVLRRCIRPGLVEFLRSCRTQGLRLAVFSDYPAEAKLDALGLGHFFDVVLSAQSPVVGVFKPHPKGLLVVAERLALEPSDCMYVGDRADVDGAAAAAAGMRCFILTRVAGFPQLSERLNRPSTSAERTALPTLPII